MNVGPSTGCGEEGVRRNAVLGLTADSCFDRAASSGTHGTRLAPASRTGAGVAAGEVCAVLDQGESGIEAPDAPLPSLLLHAPSTQSAADSFTRPPQRLSVAAVTARVPEAAIAATRQ